MVEHHGRRQAFEQRGILDDLVRAHVDLDVPAEIRDALRERRDHVDRDRSRARIEHREADAANAASHHRLQLRVGHGRMHHRNAARPVAPELLNAVERHAIVGHVGGRRHDHGTRGAEALLQQPILRDRGILLHARLRARPRGREALAVVDVHVAVAGIRRRLELRRLGAGGVWNTVLGEARCCRHRQPSRKKRPAPDAHLSPPFGGLRPPLPIVQQSAARNARPAGGCLTAIAWVPHSAFRLNWGWADARTSFIACRWLWRQRLTRARRQEARSRSGVSA